MLLVQLLLRALCYAARFRSRLVVVPATALAAAFGAAMVAGAHPLHSILAAGARMLADGTLTSGGGPPNP